MSTQMHTRRHTKLPVQRLGLALQQVGVIFSTVNILKGVCHLQPNNQTVHLFPQKGGPLIQLKT